MLTLTVAVWLRSVIIPSKKTTQNATPKRGWQDCPQHVERLFLLRPDLLNFPIYDFCAPTEGSLAVPAVVCCQSQD